MLVLITAFLQVGFSQSDLLEAFSVKTKSTLSQELHAQDGTYIISGSKSGNKVGEVSKQMRYDKTFTVFLKSRDPFYRFSSFANIIGNNGSRLVGYSEVSANHDRAPPGLFITFF